MDAILSENFFFITNILKLADWNNNLETNKAVWKYVKKSKTKYIENRIEGKHKNINNANIYF